jgi:hypothetical protein
MAFSATLDDQCSVLSRTVDRSKVAASRYDRWSKTSWESSAENLVEKANRQDRNMIVHAGLIAPLRDQLLEYFRFQEDSDNLRLLIVVKEAHL